MTIKEVAKLAGVSPAAVSRYMNGGSLSEKKKVAIRNAIEQTGYHPSLAARVMRTGKMNQIGIIIPKIYSDSVSQITEGANAIISEKGYMLVVCSTNGEEERERGYLELMENNHAAGVIVMGTSRAPHVTDGYFACQMPLVVTGQNIPGLPCVYHDDLHALKDLTKMFFEKRRKKIVYIGVSDNDPQVGAARFAGVKEAFREAGREMEGLINFEVPFDPKEAYQCAMDVLKKISDIDGIICATDTLATGAMRAIKENGRTVGDDISIAGVGDSWMNNYTPDPLTTAHFYYRQCGEEAAEMLLDAIRSSKDHKPFPARQVCLEYKIIDRGSI